MATLDDKLMGEKLHYYCSSSDEDDERDGDDEAPKGAKTKDPKFVPESEIPRGNAPNTGPKGVIEDWRRFKQLERENREEQEAEKLRLAKKLAMTCRTDKEDQEAKKKEEQVDQELDELLDDDYLKEYMERRMKEMMQISAPSKKNFGKVIDIENGEEFLDAIDKEDKAVNVIIFIYEQGVPGCQAMEGCLLNLAKDHPKSKFCRVRASSLPKLSKDFQTDGVPALLVYKGGEMMTNFVRISEQLGTDFYTSDVEGYLIEHGVLADRELVPSIIRGPAVAATNDSDSE